MFDPRIIHIRNVHMFLKKDCHRLKYLWRYLYEILTKHFINYLQKNIS